MKCQHENCDCDARQGDRWCSDYCQIATESAAGLCGCGHLDCEKMTAETDPARTYAF